MAGYHVSSLKPNEVATNLRLGTFALKWPEETNKPVTPIAVNLSVDPKGFYLFCLNKVTKEIECFDIALIHDTRTDSEVLLPRGAIDCDQINIGSIDVPLSSKWLTIYYGNTFIPDRDLRTIHFCFHSPIVAREWTEQLFQYGHNLLLRNLSGLECLEKIHTRVIHSLVDDRFDKRAIPVRNLIQYLCKNSRDASKETKILKTLEYLELPCRMETLIDPDQFTFDKFVRFYMQLMERHEIDKLFDATKSEIDVTEGIRAMLPGGKHRRYLSWEKIRDFIVKQNDARGDGLGKGYYDQKAKDLVKKYTQHDEHFVHKGMNDESFLRYLLSFDNLIVDPAKFDLCMDMDKPLAHYFISSSHNTYLTGSQLHGRASTEMYRQVLLTGCRCIELDVVDSERKSDEPDIKHRNTPVRSVPFIQVIHAIRQCAFKVSPYPLVLSLENHCTPRAQAKMAQYLIDTFGDSLITQPLKTHPCDDNCPLPSPNDLKYKILIKNKKLHQSTNAKVREDTTLASVQKTESIATITSDQSTGLGSISASPPLLASAASLPTYSIRRKRSLFSERQPGSQTVEFDLTSANENNRSGVLTEEEDNSSDDDDVSIVPVQNLEATDSVCTSNAGDLLLADASIISFENPTYPTNSDLLAESKATKAMSDLVHYMVPVRFVTFTRAEERKRSYEISSFAEDKAQSLIRDYAKEFVAYNHRQLSRIYPRGTRIDSSNYNPYLFWPAGCQMVALNYQTLDTPMQLNLALFSFNGACGYIEKPAALCQSTGSFNPKGRTNVENVVGYQIEIKVISGQFLCQDREPSNVDIEMYGTYADATKRHEYRLRAKRWNGFQAVYDDTDIDSGEFSIRFSKVILPEMASLRFAVSEEDGTFVGQSFLPVAHLRAGYRHVVLRNQMNIPVQSASLFVYIRKDVHVDAENKDLIDQLVSPTSVPLPVNQSTKQTRFKPLCEQRSHSIGDLELTRKLSGDPNDARVDEPKFPSHPTVRRQYPSTTKSDTLTLGLPMNNRRRNQSTPFIDPNWYHNQLITTSQLHNQEHLCPVLVLDNVEQMKVFKRERDKIQGKVRRVSVEYDKRIQNEEDRFQKCLSRQSEGATRPLSRPIHHWPDAEFGNTPPGSPIHARTSSFTLPTPMSEDVKEAESRLLDLYSNKFHSQNELEYKHSKEYYNDLEKYVIHYYNKQLNRINYVLKQEQAKVKGDVRVQMKSETKKTIMTETDREKIVNLKEKIRQMNIEAGALAIRKLQEMHEHLEKTIRSNLQATLNHLHEGKDLETKSRFNKYLSQLNEIKVRLQADIHGSGSLHSPPSSRRRPVMTAVASVSAVSLRHSRRPASSTSMELASPSAVLTSQPTSRRQTISSNCPDDKDCVPYLNATTESTKL